MTKWEDSSIDILERIHAWQDADTTGQLTGRDWYRVAVDLLCDAHDVIESERKTR